ncbi:hypothetical protein BV898_03101 [Hypsibius exemplaris]|uniref:Protein kinase domain-containing protein n=1 Tax=Hypsibius exemplaris TaxID=2072580 RepID=A0A1W0X6D5_HYPEX|nr:hypothetical protein BV898_03101 [Hypsibius exemplaris]
MDANSSTANPPASEPELLDGFNVQVDRDFTLAVNAITLRNNRGQLFNLTLAKERVILPVFNILLESQDSRLLDVPDDMLPYFPGSLRVIFVVGECRTTRPPDVNRLNKLLKLQHENVVKLIGFELQNIENSSVWGGDETERRKREEEMRVLTERNKFQEKLRNLEEETVRVKREHIESKEKLRNLEEETVRVKREQFESKVKLQNLEAETKRAERELAESLVKLLNLEMEPERVKRKRVEFRKKLLNLTTKTERVKRELIEFQEKLLLSLTTETERVKRERVEFKEKLLNLATQTERVKRELVESQEKLLNLKIRIHQTGLGIIIRLDPARNSGPINVPVRTISSQTHYCWSYGRRSTLSWDYSLLTYAKAHEFSSEQVMQYTSQLLDALEYFHSQDLTVGVLQTDSIFLSSDQQCVKLVDLLNPFEFPTPSALRSLMRSEASFYMHPDAIATAVRVCSNDTSFQDMTAEIEDSHWDLWSLGCVILDLFSNGNIQHLDKDGNLIDRYMSADDFCCEMVAGGHPYVPTYAPVVIRRLSEQCFVRENRPRLSAAALRDFYNECTRMVKMYEIIRTSSSILLVACYQWDRIFQRGLIVVLLSWNIIQVASGLEYLHNRKENQANRLEVYHGDLKGANVFLTADGKTCKIGDMENHFLFLENHQGKTEPEGLRPNQGTVLYLAPERLSSRYGDVPTSSIPTNRPKPIGRASDIWSFGCLVLEMFNKGRVQYKTKDGRVVVLAPEHPILGRCSYEKQDLQLWRHSKKTTGSDFLTLRQRTLA